MRDPRTAEQAALLERLEAAATAIQAQLRTDRRRAIWALADLGLIRILLYDDEPASAFADFLSEAPPGFVCNSLLSTLIPLSELDIDPKQRLQKAVELIQSVAR